MSVSCYKDYSLTVIEAPPENPNGFWKLEEATGNRTDSVASLVLTETSGPVNSAAGIIGDGAKFDATGGTLFSSFTLPGLVTTPGTSFAFWVKFTSTKGAAINFFRVIFGVTPIYLQLTNGQVDTDNHLRLKGYISSGGFEYDFGIAALGSWYFCAGTVNAVTNEVRLYLNGNQVQSQIVTGSVGLVFAYSLMLLNPNNCCDCVVDECAIWCTHVLTDAEVAWLYNAGAGKTYPFV